jgi:hypothetical protein
MAGNIKQTRTMFIRLNFRLKKKERTHDQNLFDIRFSYVQVTHTYIPNGYKRIESLLMICQNRQDHLYK